MFFSYSLDKINWLTDTPSSDERITSSLCFSAGTLNLKGCAKNITNAQKACIDGRFED